MIVIWEICATQAAEVKRTNENVLPHLSGVIDSLTSDRQINGSQTALGMVLEKRGATRSRAAVGYVKAIPHN